MQQGPFALLDSQYFGVYRGEDGAVRVTQRPTVDDVGSVAVFDEDFQQSERYIDTELGVPVNAGSDRE